MNPDLVALVRLVHQVVAEDEERRHAECRWRGTPGYLPVGCAVCGEVDLPAVGHCDTCPGTLED